MGSTGEAKETMGNFQIQVTVISTRNFLEVFEFFSTFSSPGVPKTISHCRGGCKECPYQISADSVEHS